MSSCSLRRLPFDVPARPLQRASSGGGRSVRTCVPHDRARARLHPVQARAQERQCKPRPRRRRRTPADQPRRRALAAPARSRGQARPLRQGCGAVVREVRSRRPLSPAPGRAASLSTCSKASAGTTGSPSSGSSGGYAPAATTKPPTASLSAASRSGASDVRWVCRTFRCRGVPVRRRGASGWCSRRCGAGWRRRLCG